MTEVSGRAEPGVVPLKEIVKKRKCLRCLNGFLSAWSGERVCARCKSTTSWRSGAPVSSSLYSGSH